MRPLIFALAATTVTLAAGPAMADPCKAIADNGALPGWITPGQTLTGTVRYVGDGDSLCIGQTADNARWIEIRLEDFNAPELNEPGGQAAKRALIDIAMGRTVRCVGRRVSWDRLVAVCTLDGVSLGDRMRAAGIVEGGR